MAKSDGAGAAEYSVRAQFDDLCRQLSESPNTARLEKPLGYWALAGDRRLPYALLEKRVSAIIQSPFSELSRTPGIGKKKMASLVMLLERVLRDNSAVSVVPEPAANPLSESFNWDTVSESQWEVWRQTVRANQLSSAPLGRFAPSLQSIPSVIWSSPLSTYLDTSLTDMQAMKAHGDKRVRGVVEVFYHIHRALGLSGPGRHLTVQLRPAFAVGAEQWLMEALSPDEPPTHQDLRQGIALPLLNQIELDGGSVIGQLAAGRLGIESPPESVIEQAEKLGVTRARVYQLLDVCADIMTVRWPEGRWWLNLLAQKILSAEDSDPRRDMMRTLVALFYPNRAARPAGVTAESTSAPAPPVMETSGNGLEDTSEIETMRGEESLKVNVEA